MMSSFEDDLKRNGYSLDILTNHSRTLSRKAECQPTSHQLECNVTERSCWRDPALEALFKDEQFRIYCATAQLRGRSRDVMSLRALGRCHCEIRAELETTPANFYTTLRTREPMKDGGSS
jgi:hypothetical protein